jgi:hypothetical protein
MLNQKIMMKHQHKMFRAQNKNENDELVYNSFIKEH